MKRNKGFTLVELIIVLALLTGVLAFFWNILNSSSKDAYTINDKIEVQNSVTSLMNAIQQDIQEAKIIAVSENKYGIFTTPIDSDKIYESKRYEFGDGSNKKIYEFDASNRTVTRTIIKEEESETGVYDNIVGFSIKKPEKRSDYGAEVNIIGSKKNYTGGPSGGNSGIIENSAVAVGSYIDYTGGDYTGKWVVLRNNGGNIEIISKESVGDLTLGSSSDVEKAKSDYANCVQILNDYCSNYVNSTYATSGRSVGATSSSIGMIDTTQYPLNYGVSGYPYHDEYYIADSVLIANIKNLRHTSGFVWLASRYLDDRGGSFYFFVRGLGSGGSDDSSFLFRAYSVGGGYSYVDSRGVRPVITLKSNIRITGGNGTEGSPYTIAIGGSGNVGESSDGIDKSRYTLNSTFYTRNTSM